MSLFKAMTTKDARTENGMATHSTSSDAVLDLFFKMGGWNASTSISEIETVLSRAYAQDRLLTTKAIFYNRDIRGGQGRRSTFQVMFKWLCVNYPEVAVANLDNVPFYGRWDDVFAGLGTPITGNILDLILKALKSGDKLCAKWMPRENKKLGWVATKWLIPAFGISRKSYRKLLSGNTEVVETLMCKGKWKAIDYNHIPSVAINKYRGAWYRHDESRFTSWVESLTKEGTVNKIHADAIYPHDIVKKIGITISANNKMLEAQWKALPNYMPEGRKILPVCDVSGSMNGEPMEVCVSLGLYLSERNVGPFKDGFITFSSEPKLQILSGSLAQRIQQLKTSNWQMSTNLEKVFNLVLSKALAGGVAQEDMPEDILILSDMQFNACVNGMSAMEMIRSKYRQSGYNMPNIIFWNLRTSSGIPAKMDEHGVALVSGFSPSIMKSLLGGDITPIKMMLKVLNSDRYERVN